MTDPGGKEATASPPTSTNEKAPALNQAPANVEAGPEEPKKRRPERTATFQDYLVCFISSISLKFGVLTGFCRESSNMLATGTFWPMVQASLPPSVQELPYP